MTCHTVQELLSSYMDGAAGAAETRAVTGHLRECGACERELRRLEQTQKLVAGLPQPEVPAAVELRLQVALSQAMALRSRRFWQGFSVRLQDAASSFMLPATAGVMSAVLAFALVIGYIVAPSNVEASNADSTPMMLYTPPQLNSSPFLTTVGRMDGSLVVETYVDANGRVQDYRILAAPEGTEKLIPELDNMMIFTTFRPAMKLGTPTPGTVVLSFAGISVRG